VNNALGGSKSLNKYREQSDRGPCWPSRPSRAGGWEPAPKEKRRPLHRSTRAWVANTTGVAPRLWRPGNRGALLCS